MTTIFPNTPVTAESSIASDVMDIIENVVDEVQTPIEKAMSKVSEVRDEFKAEVKNIWEKITSFKTFLN